jgi:hypothetical protein
MTTRPNEKVIETLAGKWFDPQTKTISRRMKNVDKLVEYAHFIAEKAFIPNNFNGRNGYEGRYELRVWDEEIYTRNGIEHRITEAYYPITVNFNDGKIGIHHNGIITKNGDFWYYYMRL